VKNIGFLGVLGVLSISAAACSSGDGASLDADSDAETAAASGDGASAASVESPTNEPSAGDEGVVEKFSFFVTSLAGMRRLSGSQDGFGGDLRFGEETGLEGADKICRTLAEESMPGAGQKEWRAFLSTTKVHAAKRIGNGPWFDRLGRLVGRSLSDLLRARPENIDPAITDDLPNETGMPNGQDGCDGTDCPDNHDTLTASQPNGTWDGNSTCDDWTSTQAIGKPRVGHSWGADSGQSWIHAHLAGGCQPGIQLVQKPGSVNKMPTVGAGGGYGGIYCFALTP